MSKSCKLFAESWKMRANLCTSWVMIQLSDAKSLADTEVPPTTGVQGYWTNLHWLEDGFGNGVTVKDMSLYLTLEKAVDI